MSVDRELEELHAVALEAAEATRADWRAAGRPSTVEGLHRRVEAPELTAMLRAERHLLAATVALTRRRAGGQIGQARSPDRTTKIRPKLQEVK